MKNVFTFLAVVATALAQGVTQNIAPPGSYPAGCSKDYAGQMEVTVETVANARKRSLMPQVSQT